MRTIISRLTGKFRRVMADRLDRRIVPIKTSVPIISFTFDDAPETAFREGGEILLGHGSTGTYFLSLGLLGRATEVGKIAARNDLEHALARGHELGCHTFDHLDAWHTPSAAFMTSIAKNKQAIAELVPGAEMKTFAYPKSGPKFSVKRMVGQRFVACRGGGQVANVDTADLNLLKACFLDARTQVDMDFIMRLIDDTVSARGWLIFATHDIRRRPSPYGCTPAFFSAVVSYAACSNALLLPLGKACEHLIDLSNKSG